MEVSSALETFVPPRDGVVLTIGNFDGVHLGHVQIINTARSVAQRFGSTVVVLTFDPHPLAILAPERAPAQLTLPAEKLALLARCHVKRGIVLRTDPTLLARTAEDFLASLVAHCRPRAFVEGPDFTFGHGRSGSVETLRRHAEHWGYEVHQVPALHCETLSTHPTISSSSIRQALVDGRVDEANAMLGRPYCIVGTIGHGAGRGDGLGFPTANLTGIQHLLPQQAVYAAVAQLEDGTFHLTAVNIGPQPTFAEDTVRVEAFLLDFAGNLRGQRIALHFLDRLREQTRFADADALVAQIKRDVAETRAYEGMVQQLARGHVLSLM